MVDTYVGLQQVRCLHLRAEVCGMSAVAYAPAIGPSAAASAPLVWVVACASMQINKVRSTKIHYTTSASPCLRARLPQEDKQDRKGPDTTTTIRYNTSNTRPRPRGAWLPQEDKHFATVRYSAIHYSTLQ